jgi:hypothetical protein
LTIRRQTAGGASERLPGRLLPEQQEHERPVTRGVREPPQLDPLQLARMGNHAASQAVGRLQVSRFESMEHKKMGDIGSEGATMQLAPGLTVSFGDITALAGDYFGSVQQIQALAGIPGSPAAPYSVIGSIDEIKYALYVEVQKTMKADQFDEGVVNAAKRRYFGLASQNASHFSQPELGDELLTQQQRAAKGGANNAGSYFANHELAIEAAIEAGSGQCGPLDQALLYEGFASHFLTDAFAGGHTRTPRTSISDWWNPKVPMFWHNLKLWLAENIAKHLNDNTIIAGAMTINYLWKEAIDVLEGVMAEKGIPDLTFGDAIGGALHDLDNLEGVEAQVGDQFVTLVGDGQVLDAKDRELARGSETLKLAAASVKVSIKDIHDAYEHAIGGMTDPAEVKQAVMTPDGMYRAEQLWPHALPDTQVANPSLNWMVGSVTELLANPRIQEALTHFAHEKADTLGGEVELDPPFKLEKQAALKWTLEKLKQDQAGVMKVFNEIVDYTPGLATAGSPEGEGELTGLFGDTSDDNARAYYKTAEKKGALHTLSIAQRQRLIRLALDGATGDDDEAMIVGLLNANYDHIVPVLDGVGWRNVWKDMDGEECRQFLNTAGPTYWRAQSYSRKRDEVGYLADGSTGEISQEAIIVILRTCTPAEVQRIDDEVGGRLGLSWDLDGAEQDEFDKLKAGP